MKWTMAFLWFSMIYGLAYPEYELTILHTNDVRARFEPINEFDAPCTLQDKAFGKCFGGTARMKTAIDEARLRSKNPILIDAGNQFQGTLLFTYYKSKIVAELMNRLDYEAMTVGHHEFDDGPQALGDFIDAVNFPVIAANINTQNDDYLKSRLVKSAIVVKGGEKIGIIGVATKNLTEISSAGKDIDMLDIESTTRFEVQKMQKQKINKIIAVTQIGEEKDNMLARKVAGIDVIIGSQNLTKLNLSAEETTKPYPQKLGNTYYVSLPIFGKYLGEINVIFDKEGNVTQAVGQPILLDDRFAEDETIQALISDRMKPLESVRGKVIATTAQFVDGDSRNCRARECQMGNLVADAMLDLVSDLDIDIAIQNGGGVRSSIGAGNITMDEVLRAFPFQNTIATFRLSGQELLNALENGVSEVGQSLHGKFPQISGMRFSFDMSKPIGQRICEVEVQGKPLNTKETYGIVSNNFLRHGGDGYTMFEDAEDAWDFGPDVANVVVDYLRDHPNYQPYKDGRIQVCH